MSGHLFIITAASGAGKTSLVHALLASDSNIKLSVSYTTRQPRPGEVDGSHYHFVEEVQFLSMLAAGDFLESAHVHGARYGTSKTRVDEALASGQDLILEIDWQGAAQVRQLYPNAVSIFILPPSMTALESRLRGRAQDRDSLQDLVAIGRAVRLKCATQLTRHAALIKDLI